MPEIDSRHGNRLQGWIRFDLAPVGEIPVGFGGKFVVDDTTLVLRSSGVSVCKLRHGPAGLACWRLFPLK